jgi:hypothetical protein
MPHTNKATVILDAQGQKITERCPDCDNERACYSCATQGGWKSEVEYEEESRVPI